VGPTLYLTYRTQEPELPSRFVKALIDRSVGLVMLLMTLPLTLVIALAVKLSSRGPVLFVQERGGLHGRPFRMLKFRTMREGAEAERAALLAANEMDGPVFKIAEDPRVTRLGRLLRRTSMDELPQLLNVVLGHMSLVGPRPLPLLETRALSGIHRRRLSMRPGITCLWQISGRNELGFREWMALDLQYVDHWSLGLDLAILLRTLPALLTARGAR
jgi:lipopolysaccharide/colanic/teichoic acid biosynthesis glycosyltransferase